MHQTSQPKSQKSFPETQKTIIAAIELIKNNPTTTG
jgi:hypothetical protein